MRTPKRTLSPLSHTPTAPPARRYVDGRRFSALFGDILFRRYDDDDGLLGFEQAQQALKWLVRPPKEGGPKPDVPFACPPGTYDASGELRLPRDWFAMLYRAMP